MRPSQLKSLIQVLRTQLEVLRNSLGLIRESVDDQTAAIKHAHETDQHGWKADIPARLAELCVPDEEKRDAGRYRKKNHCQQVILNIITGFAFVAAGIIGGFQIYISFKIRDIYNWQKEADISTHRPIVTPVWFSVNTYADRMCERSDGICQIEEFIQNVGSAPTKCLRIQSDTRVGNGSDFPLPATFRYDKAGSLAPQGAGAFPYIPMIKITFPLDQGTKQELITGRVSTGKSLYAFGRISYWDVFPEPNWHLVEYCAHFDDFHLDKIDPKKSRADGILWIPASPCENESRKWNCFDNDCPDYEQLKEDKSFEPAKSSVCPK